MSNQEPTLDLWTLSDLCTPWCIRVVADAAHRRAHRFRHRRYRRDSPAATKSDAHVLHSVLSYLVTRGSSSKSPLGHFALNETARGLLDAGAVPLPRRDRRTDGGRLEHAARLRAHRRAWLRAACSVRRSGTTSREHPDLAADFDALMSYAGPWNAGRLAAAHRRLGRRAHRRGCRRRDRGDACRAAARAADIRGVLVDLPATVARVGS